MSKFNITPETKSEETSRNFIDVGIHENVELINVKLDKSPNGNNFIVFEFSKDGKVLTHTEWEPKDNDPEVLKSKIENQMKRLKHIATKFVSGDDLNISADNFENLAAKYIAILGNKYKGVKVRVKVVYSNNGFTTLPKYIPFIENMNDTPKEKSKLEIISIDRMTREPRVSTTSVEENPFGSEQVLAKADENQTDQVKEPVTEQPPF